MGPQLAPNCLTCAPRRSPTGPTRSCSRCSDPNGDKIALTVVRQPRTARSGIATATGSVLYRPAPGYTGPDSFTYTASDGLDVSASGTATVSVALPAKAPVVRIRTGRTHLLARSASACSWTCPPAAIGPCRFATRLIVNGRSTYAFVRIGAQRRPHLHPRGRHEGRTKAQFIVTVRDQTRQRDRLAAHDRDPALGSAGRLGGRVLRDGRAGAEDVAVAVDAVDAAHRRPVLRAAQAAAPGSTALLARVRMRPLVGRDISAVCGALHERVVVGRPLARRRPRRSRRGSRSSRRRSGRARRGPRDSVGSTISVPATGNDIVGAWKP